MMNSTSVIAILIFLYVVLIWKSGKSYPILYLFLFTFFLQYIFSTYFVYNVYRELKVQMPIKQEELFSYAIPALGSLFLGVLVFNKDFNMRDLVKKIDHQAAKRLGYLLLIISYTFDFAKFFGLSMFGSLVSFTAYLKYIGAFCFLFSNSWFLYALAGLVYFHLTVIVLRSGVFIDLIAWGTFLFFFICLRLKLSFAMRSLIFMGAIPLLILIQSVKDEYRKATWPTQREGGFGLFSELAQKKSEENKGEPFERSQGVESTIARLSQGWHLGLTLKRVPKKEPFANGKEIWSDIVSSLLPRFIFQDKKVVHTKEKFFQYTGHKLGRNTAMTIGILGDFYINFGREGSYIMLFVFGGLVAKLVRLFLVKYVLHDPINIVWLPYLLSYLVRADNDFYIFFNCVVKGFIIFLAVNYYRVHYLEPKPFNQLARL